MSNSLQPQGLQHTRLPCPILLLEFAQTHIHWVSDAIQPSHPLYPLLLLPSIFPSIRIFSNESVLCISSQSIGASASVLPMNIQSGFPLGLTGLISLLSKGLSRVFSSHSSKAYILHHSNSLWSNSHICTRLLGKPQVWLYRPLLAMWRPCFLIYCLGLSQLFFQRVSIF